MDILFTVFNKMMKNNDYYTEEVNYIQHTLNEYDSEEMTKRMLVNEMVKKS